MATWVTQTEPLSETLAISETLVITKKEGNFVNPLTYGGYKDHGDNKKRGGHGRDRHSGNTGIDYRRNDVYGDFDPEDSEGYLLPGYGRYGNYDSYRYYGPGENPETSDLYGLGYEYDYPAQPLPGLYYGDDDLGPGYGTYQALAGMSVRYGDGGYGDPNYVNFNPRACTQKDQKNCTDNDPDANSMQWRFIKDIGWRKMGNYGAARKDWWDYKSSVPLPFNFYNFPRF